jgi:DnaJ family protein A protein 3
MGSRMHIPNPCLECEGKGSTVQRKKVTVPVPAGRIPLYLYFIF